MLSQVVSLLVSCFLEVTQVVAVGGEVNSLQVTAIFVAKSRGVTKQVTLLLDLS